MTRSHSRRPEPDPGPDVDRLLADWLVDEAPTHEPPVLLNATLARTALTRRKPGWLVADRWLRPPIGRAGGPWRTHPMLTTLTALALASGASLLRLATATDDVSVKCVAAAPTMEKDTETPTLSPAADATNV